MKFKLDSVKAKEQAKRLAQYLTSINRTICHGSALEAVARMYGVNGWNALAAELAETEKQAVSGSDANIKFAIRATISDDASSATFDAAPWFAQADDQAVLDLQKRGWCEASSSGTPVAEFIRAAGDRHVDKVWVHWLSTNSARMPLSKVDLRVEIDERDALAYVRAFRYPLFVKLMLVKQFGSLAGAVREENIEVFPDVDQPGRWTFRVGAEGADISYPDEAESYAALGTTLEDRFEEWGLDTDTRDVKPGSDSSNPHKGDSSPQTMDLVLGRLDEPETTGAVLVLKQGQAPLTKQELRRITNEGEFPLQVAVPVNLEEMSGNGIDWLNDEVSERITGSCCDLVDISYERYAPLNESEFIDTKKMVLMKVTASWEPSEGMYDEDEEGEGESSAD